MCSCSSLELAMWGAGVGAVAYFISPTPISVGLGVTVGILYARSRPSKKNNEQHDRARVSLWN